MKRTSILIFAILVSMLSIISVSAQPGSEPAKPKADDAKKESPVGVKWEVMIAAPGQDYAGILKIERSGDKLTGSITTELGEAPLSGIKVDGDSFTSIISVSAQGQSFEGTMSGKVKDGKITGELILSGLGSIPYTGGKSRQ